MLTGRGSDVTRQLSSALALDLQVERDLVRAPVVAGHAAVVSRILGLHRADDEAAVGVDAAPAVHQDVGGRPVGAEGKEAGGVSGETLNSQTLRVRLTFP